jgi:hypothetical protein
MSCAVHIAAGRDVDAYRDAPARITELQDRIAKLEATVAGLTAWDIGRMRQDLTTLQEDVAFLKLSADESRYAELGIGQDGFQRVDSSTGSFFVSVQKVLPFADGSRLVLDVGNPSTATYDGVQADVRYGRRFDPANGDSYFQWHGSLKTANVKVSSKLLPGTWNRVTLTLGGIKPDVLGYVQLSLSTDRVVLRNP